MRALGPHTQFVVQLNTKVVDPTTPASTDPTPSVGLDLHALLNIKITNVVCVRVFYC